MDNVRTSCSSSYMQYLVTPPPREMSGYINGIVKNQYPNCAQIGSNIIKTAACIELHCRVLKVIFTMQF